MGRFMQSLFGLVTEEESGGADIDVGAPVARRQLEELQLQLTSLLGIAVLGCGVGGQLGPLRLGQRRSGLGRGVHFLHRIHAGCDGVEQRLGEQQVWVERQRLVGGSPGEVPVSRRELIEGFEVRVRSLRRIGGDADSAALRRGGEERTGAERCERCHWDSPFER